MFQKTNLIFRYLLMPLGVLFSTPSYAETLSEALIRAYSTNPVLLAARAELRSVDERVPQALGGWRPTIAISGNLGGQWERSNVLIARSEERVPRGATLEISQPLYRGGRTVAETAQAEAQVLAQREVLRSVEQDVLLQSVTAYMDVLRDMAVVDLTKNNEEVIRQQLEVTNERFNVGELTVTDVAQSESRLSRATAQRVQAEGDLVASRARYRQVIGEWPQDVDLPEKISLALPVSLDDAVAASDDNPRVKAAGHVEVAAEHGVDAAFGALLPTLELLLSLSTVDDVGRRDLSSDEATVQARLTVPLYQAGSVEARVRELKEVRGQRRFDREAERRDAAQRAVTAWESVQTARAQITSFEKEVEATRIALEGTREESEVGARTILDILDAEQEYLDAQVNLIRSQRNEIVASYELLASAGRLTAGDLGLPVTIYDPKKHYDQTRNRWWGTGVDDE